MCKEHTLQYGQPYWRVSIYNEVGNRSLVIWEPRHVYQ